MPKYEVQLQTGRKLLVESDSPIDEATAYQYALQGALDQPEKPGWFQRLATGPVGGALETAGRVLAKPAELVNEYLAKKVVPFPELFKPETYEGQGNIMGAVSQPFPEVAAKPIEAGFQALRSASPDLANLVEAGVMNQMAGALRGPKPRPGTPTTPTRLTMDEFLAHERKAGRGMPDVAPKQPVAGPSAVSPAQPLPPQATSVPTGSQGAKPATSARGQAALGKILAGELGVKEEAVQTVGTKAEVPTRPELRPAIQIGEKVIEGKPGEPHATILPDEATAAAGIKSGWVDPAGKFLTQEEAAALRNEPLTSLIKRGFGSETGSVGKLTPEQQAAEVQARLARRELYRRVEEAAGQAGEDFTAAAQRLGIAPNVTAAMTRERYVDNVQATLGQAGEALNRLNERARILMAEQPIVEQTGTLGKDVREFFRSESAGPKPDTYKFRTAEADVDAIRLQLEQVTTQLTQADRDLAGNTDPLLRPGLERLQQRAIDDINAVSEMVNKIRLSEGRQVRAWQDPAVISTLRLAQNAAERYGIAIKLTGGKLERAPIHSEMLDFAKRIRSLKPSEWAQFGRDVVDSVRWGNFIKVMSVSLDLISNASELGLQAIGGLTYDVAHAARGYPTFPSTTGLLRAIINRKPAKLDPALQQELGLTGYGERGIKTFGRVGTPGTFTRRRNVVSTVWDNLMGVGVYPKGFADSYAKNLSANMHMVREAIVAADRQGLHGVPRSDFIQQFMDTLPDYARDIASTEGNKAGFNRPLGTVGRWVSSNTLVKLAFDAFPAWAFQHTRWLAEVLGWNRELFKRTWRGEATPEELAGYASRTATGASALYLANLMFADHTNPDTMQYVDPVTQDPMRLAGRDPIPAALFLGAVLRGEAERAWHMLPYVNLPLVKVLAGSGGIFTELLYKMTETQRNPESSLRQLAKSAEDTINEIITPGFLTVLNSAINTIMEGNGEGTPIHEGIGAHIPFLSQLLPQAINPTTGEPLRIKQRLPNWLGGAELPTNQGVVVPGSYRVLNPVEKLLNRYGFRQSRGLRQPIVGAYPSEAPDEFRREWQMSFGQTRNQLLSDILPTIQQLERENPGLKPGDDVYESIRRMIDAQDARASSIATREINTKYETPFRLPRRVTGRERFFPRPEESLP